MPVSEPSIAVLPKGSRDRQASEVWLRISAFLQVRSVNTRRTYAGIVREWCEFLGVEAGSAAGAAKIIEASDLHSLGYRKWLEGQPGQKPRMQQSESGDRSIAPKGTKSNRGEFRDGLQNTQANATIAKKFAALRRIYKMLIASGLAGGPNPFDIDRVAAPSARSGQKRPTEMIPFELVTRIISQPSVKTPKGLRDRAALALLFGAGLRRSELVRLRLGDLRRSQQGTWYVHLRSTKAKRDADQALPDWAADPLLDLVAARERTGAVSGDFVFVSYRGRGGSIPTAEPLSDSGLYKLFKQYCRRAGVAGFVSPHSARATAITKLLSDGLDHRSVQEFSRHASIQMVEVYDKRRLGIDKNPARGLNYR